VPLLERKLEGQEEGSICEGFIGGGGIGFGSLGDVQYEFSTGAEICGDSPRDDGEDPGIGAESRQKQGARSPGFWGTSGVTKKT